MSDGKRILIWIPVDSNLRLFILPVTQAKEAKIPTIPTTKITTSLTRRSMSQIWPLFVSHKNVPKNNPAKFEAHPFDRVWVDGASEHPHFPAMLPDLIRWENPFEKWSLIKIRLKTDLLSNCPKNLAPPQSTCYGSRKISYAVNAWVLIPQYRTGWLFQREKSHLLRAKSIEITVTDLDQLLIQSSKVDWNWCRFIEFHDWSVLVRTSVFHEGTN